MPPPAAKLVGLYPTVPHLTLGSPQSWSHTLLAPRILDMPGRSRSFDFYSTKSKNRASNKKIKDKNVDIVAEVPGLRHLRGLSRILGASRVWDQDWGLPKVKCGTVGCNQTSLAPGGASVASAATIILGADSAYPLQDTPFCT